MSNNPIPTFDEWVSYCFTKGRADFNTLEGKSWRYNARRLERYTLLPPVVLADYAIRLFSDPFRLVNNFTDERIADGAWFLFSCESGYPNAWFSKQVAFDRRIEVMRSIVDLYVNCFDLVCNRRGADPDGFYTNTLPVDIAVGMIWDMQSGIDCAMHSGLEGSGFEVLEAALFRCRTASCKGSSLHGLGHLVDAYPDRARSMIDRFLTLPNQPEHLREYALEARTGRIL
jgi:hypothetical protein